MDTLNHITDLAELSESIARISLFLEPGRLFIFDINSPLKHSDILGDNTFVLENDVVFCTWQNYTDSDLLTEIYLDFFVQQPDGSYHRFSEDFCERGYYHEEVCEILKNADLELVAVLGDMSDNAPKSDEERIFYVTRKKSNG